MRNLLALVGLIVVLFVGIGWYCQWYTFSAKTGVDGKTQYQLDVDSKKMASDAKRLGDRVGTAVQPTATQTTPPSAPSAPEPATPPTGGPTFEIKFPRPTKS